MPLSHFSLQEGKVYVLLHFFYFFFFPKYKISEWLCMHSISEKLKATKWRGSSSVEEVALETGISESAAQKLFYYFSQCFSVTLWGNG